MSDRSVTSLAGTLVALVLVGGCDATSARGARGRRVVANVDGCSDRRAVACARLRAEGTEP